MNKLDEAGLKVGEAYAGLYSGDREFALDPQTILVMIEIIKEIIQLWAKCKASGAQAKEIAQNPGPLQRLLLRRRTKEVLGNRLFRERGEQTVAALLKAGADADPEFLQDLIDGE